MSKLRFRVVESAFKKRAAEVAAPAERPSEYFGKNVFIVSPPRCMIAVRHSKVNELIMANSRKPELIFC